ncbi:hypothetical protein GCM10023189_34640 [Nibrella saemangeumensis]|uniref:Por secretion system C-terminal sorting domain-containing protein n=1 Tax=Nibrella saemangeumensis TaxID=1084526 RepID=A0ABP8N581_9BACT
MKHLSFGRVWYTYLLLVALGIGAASPAFAQKGVAKWLNEVRSNRFFPQEELFSGGSPHRRNQQVLEQGTALQLNRGAINRLLNSPHPALTLTIPVAGGPAIQLELARVEVTTSDFTVGTRGNTPQENMDVDRGVHYRGIIKGNANSLAAISVFRNEVSGIISDETGNWVIGRMDDGSEDHILYQEKDLKVPHNFTCFAEDKSPVNDKGGRVGATSGIACKTVTVYFEADYKLYLDKGSSVTNVSNYVNGFFNQVATLYQNENIDIQISQLYIWTSTDPYASTTSTSTALTAFRNRIGSNFTGNLAHLLTTRSLGGGIAYLDVLCAKSYAHGVSMIYNSFSTYPTYSWTVEVVTHELGHNIGSNHTQWCGWVRTDGTKGALDNCYTTEAVNGVSCPPGPAPTNGGTIMSYCHLTSTGINFQNGFGPVPGNLIRSRVQNASCIVSGGNTAAPTGLVTADITQNSATLSWNPVQGAVNYSVEYKLSSASTWTSAGTTTSTSRTLSGLTAGQSYNWRVKSDCSGFSTAVTFTTQGAVPCAAPGSLVASDLTHTSATLSWGAVAEATSYTVQYRMGSAASWIVLPSVTGTSYALTGLLATTTYDWQVKANCSDLSVISSFTTTAPPAACQPPTNLVATSAGSGAVNLNWDAVSSAQVYTVQYKLSNEKSWTTTITVQTNSIKLSGLNSRKTYNWRVKADCSGYSAPESFSPSSLPAGTLSLFSTDEFMIYPNPAQDYIQLRIANAEEAGGNATYRILDLKGNVKQVIGIKGFDQKADLSSLPTGVYLIQMTGRSGKVTSKLFIKE